MGKLLTLETWSSEKKHQEVDFPPYKSVLSYRSFLLKNEQGECIACGCSYGELDPSWWSLHSHEGMVLLPLGWVEIIIHKPVALGFKIRRQVKSDEETNMNTCWFLLQMWIARAYSYWVLCEIGEIEQDGPKLRATNRENNNAEWIKSKWQPAKKEIPPDLIHSQSQKLLWNASGGNYTI